MDLGGCGDPATEMVGGNLQPATCNLKPATGWVGRNLQPETCNPDGWVGEICDWDGGRKPSTFNLQPETPNRWQGGFPLSAFRFPLWAASVLS